MGERREPRGGDTPPAQPAISARSVDEMKSIAARVRAHVLRMSHAARAAHLASALSCVDLLVALYWRAANVDPANPTDPIRDRCILSKGHASSALYATLAERGFFPAEQLQTYGVNDGRLAEQMTPNCAPGIEAATGSLGHGLPLGVGMALAVQVGQAFQPDASGRETLKSQDRFGQAGKLDLRGGRVWVVLSDGECNEGSVWEAAMLAASRRLDNLCVLVDYNRWQATGRSNDILALEPLDEKWRAFGFETRRVDGHDFEQLGEALDKAKELRQKPFAIIADTIKGKGVSFMEDDNNWHYRVPNDGELKAALAELGH